MDIVKNILIVVESIDVEDSSASKGRVALIKNLHSLGYNLRVFHYTRKEIQLENIDCFSIIERKRFLYFLSRAQRVIQRTFRINFSKHLENLFGFSFTYFNDVNSIKSSISNNLVDYDLVITLSKAASFRAHYALLKLPQLHSKWLAYIHDPYPFHCYPQPYNWSEPGYKQKELFFKKVSEKAKYSAFPSQLLKEWMGNFFPNFLKTGIVIPHQKFDIERSLSEFPVFFDVSKFNILHAGNLIKQRSPKGLIEGFKLFMKNNPNSKDVSRLLLLGSSSYHKSMLSDFDSEISELYISKGSIPFETVYHLQKNVSVNVILESNAEISPFLPGKFPHCVMADKPILLLAPERSETKRLLEDYYPYHSEVNAVNEIALLIQELYEQWKTNPQDLKLNRNDLEEYVSTTYLKKVISSII